MEFATHSPLETEQLAGLLASALRAGDVVTLSGGLGAGKTTFVRGVLRALGFGGRVLSPTYTLAAQYTIADLDIYHFDAYLAEKQHQFLVEGGAELLFGKSISFIEWPERLQIALPESRIDITISEGAEPNDRIFVVEGRGERGKDLLLTNAEAAR
ncbi:MAG: tRNA (adenosine(37)-N6)-threonylcarbamoyltransferase complex ATPase subunit type 1 TsaE [Planctomycetota bacterium]